MKTDQVSDQAGGGLNPGSVEAQKAMCHRAGRLAPLFHMNRFIRRFKPDEAYDDSFLHNLPDSQIDGMMELLRQEYNQIAGKAGAR